MAKQKKNNLKGSIMLLICALVWGFAFVVQSSSMETIGPLLFTNVRFFIGGIVLIPVAIFFEQRSENNEKISKKLRRKLSLNSIMPGIFCGIFLALATTFQQLGILTTSAGKSAFITAFYIIFVPVAGVFFGRKVKGAILLSIVLAIVGFWLLCIQDDFNISQGDILTVFCAIFFTVQIMLVDRAMRMGTNPIICSLIEFFTVWALTLVPTLYFEGFDINRIYASAGSILYTGIVSAGIGYTLQTLGQRETDPALATLIMSLESVFAAIFGAIFLNEILSLRELAGCALVLAAVLMAQLSSFKCFTWHPDRQGD